MWNDMREQDDSTYNLESTSGEAEAAPPAPEGNTLLREPILGMTPPQRLVVALFLLATVCILGVLFLIVFQRIYLL